MSPRGLAGLLPDELRVELGLAEGFRGRQVFGWLARGARSFDDMSDLPLELRRRLASSPVPLLSSRVDSALDDADGSAKLRIVLADGSAVEAVLLADESGRLTACLSTQVGCPMACAFCKTGTLGLLRNLEAHEMVEQYLHLSRLRGRPSNVVFMGMGEPLLNLDELRRCIAVLVHPDGLGLSHRKITVSTCGVVPGILALAAEGPRVRLAVSLTAADDGIRSALMPVNRTWDLAALKDALVRYQAATGDRITLEAAIMGGANSDVAAARAMASWIGSLKVQLNVIPWNPVPGLPYREPTRAEMRAFEAELDRLGVNAVRRTRRGRGVGGACGQLGDTAVRPDAGD